MIQLPQWVLTGYSLNPWTVLALLGSLALYCTGVVRLWSRAGTGSGISRAQLSAFIAGIVVLAVALLSPLEYAASVLFSAHMVQHMLLAYVAAPLLAWSVAGLGFLWALPAQKRVQLSRVWLGNRLLRRAVAWLTAPFTVLTLFTLSFWLWHAPVMYEAALRSPALHALEHFTMFASAFLFWWLILQPTGRRRLSRGAGVLFVLAAMLQGLVLASLLAFASSPLYPVYALSAQALGVSALQDQQLAGMIMRTPATIILLVTAVWLFVTWLGQLERHDMEYG